MENKYTDKIDNNSQIWLMLGLLPIVTEVVVARAKPPGRPNVMLTQ